MAKLRILKQHDGFEDSYGIYGEDDTVQLCRVCLQPVVWQEPRQHPGRYKAMVTMSTRCSQCRMRVHDKCATPLEEQSIRAVAWRRCWCCEEMD